MLVEHVYTALRAVYEGGLALTKPDWDSAYHISNSCLSSSDNQRVGWMSGHYMSSKCGTQNSLSGFGGGRLAMRVYGTRGVPVLIYRGI